MLDVVSMYIVNGIYFERMRYMHTYNQKEHHLSFVHICNKYFFYPKYHNFSNRQQKFVFAKFLILIALILKDLDCINFLDFENET